jgi:hypothetical protein
MVIIFTHYCCDVEELVDYAVRQGYVPSVVRSDELDKGYERRESLYKMCRKGGVDCVLTLGLWDLAESFRQSVAMVRKLDSHGVRVICPIPGENFDSGNALQMQTLLLCLRSLDFSVVKRRSTTMKRVRSPETAEGTKGYKLDYNKLVELYNKGFSNKELVVAMGASNESLHAAIRVLVRIGRISPEVYWDRQASLLKARNDKKLQKRMLVEEDMLARRRVKLDKMDLTEDEKLAVLQGVKDRLAKSRKRAEKRNNMTKAGRHRVMLKRIKDREKRAKYIADKKAADDDAKMAESIAKRQAELDEENKINLGKHTPIT